MSAVFSRLRDQELFVDVTIATADRQVIHAHRVVLSAGSEYLEKILAVSPSDHPVIVLSNLKYRELKLLIDFMYSGEISVDQPLLAGLLEAANWLKIKGLFENKMTRPEPDIDESMEAEQQPVEAVLPVRCQSEVEQQSRKRNSSSRGDNEAVDVDDIQSEATSSSSYTESTTPPPHKMPKTVPAATNSTWLVDSVGYKNPSGLTTKTDDDLPNLLSMANGQSLLNQLKTDIPKPLLESYLLPNDQMLQAMQLCGSNYLGQLAALHNCSQNNSQPAFTGSFTSYPSNNATLPGFKSGLLNTAPVRRYKQYTEDSLQAALKEIMEGQSINRSSMKHNIPARTLRDWMKRLNIKSVYTHHSTKDKEGSVGSTSPEPDVNLSLDRLRNVAFNNGVDPIGTAANTSGDLDDEETNGALKIDENCENLNSMQMAA